MSWTEAFDALTSGLEYPMFIVTAAADGERNGCLVGFATQCSIDPPGLLVCVSKANHTYRVASSAQSLVVHFLAVEDEALAHLFGESTGDDVDKFSRCAWTPRADGTPVLAECRGWAAGEVTSRTDVGDHVAFALKVTDAEHRRDGTQLSFQQVKSFTPGHPA